MSRTRVRLLLSALLFCAPASQIVAAEKAFSTASDTNFARIVAVENAGATRAYLAQPDVVREMVAKGVTALARTNDLAAAWLAFVKTNDVVGIKVFSAPGPVCGTRPSVVAAVIEGLLAARVPAAKIIVWDRRLVDLRRAGFGRLAGEFGVRLAGSMDAGWDEKVFYETPLLGSPRWGDLEFGRTDDGVGRKSYVTKIVAQEITRVISIAPLLNQNEAGVAGHLFGLALGGVDNTGRFEGDAGRLATAVPEICALPVFGDRVALNITDALLCQYAGGGQGMLHYTTVLNELRFSRDAVALDVSSVDELVRQRALMKFPAVTHGIELFKNASLLELGVADLNKIRVENIR